MSVNCGNPGVADITLTLLLPLLLIKFNDDDDEDDGNNKNSNNKNTNNDTTSTKTSHRRMMLFLFFKSWGSHVPWKQVTIKIVINKYDPFTYLSKNIKDAENTGNNICPYTPQKRLHLTLEILA